MFLYSVSLLRQSAAKKACTFCWNCGDLYTSCCWHPLANFLLWPLIHMYVYIYIYIYMHMSVHLYIYIHIYKNIYMYMCLFHICIYIKYTYLCILSPQAQAPPMNQASQLSRLLQLSPALCGHPGHEAHDPGHHLVGLRPQAALSQAEALVWGGGAYC